MLVKSFVLCQGQSCVWPGESSALLTQSMYASVAEYREERPGCNLAKQTAKLARRIWLLLPAYKKLWSRVSACQAGEDEKG